MSRAFISLALALAAGLCAPLAGAHDYTLGNLAIGHPWARATAPGAPVGGAYLSIDNKGGTEDRLVAASSPVAKSVELHQMAMEGGTMKMRAVEGGIAIPPKYQVTLRPGGYHLMMMGLAKPLVAGTRVPLKLSFEHAGTIDVELAVEAMGAGGPGHEVHKE